MEIDRKRVLDAFAEYTSHYDAGDGKIKLKIEHTYRVAGLCQRIAASLGLSSRDIDLAWLLGMLHDVGRFEQLRRFGTFSDADSIDHAHFAIEILFGQGRLADYLELPPEIQDILGEFMKEYSVEGENVLEESVKVFSENQSELGQGLNEISDRQQLFIIYTAIWNHSAYRVEEGLDKRTQMFCNILRDADKVDILKVNQDVPIEVIYNVSTKELRQAEVTDRVMQEFFNRHAILRSLKQTCVDNIVGHAALVFELVYPESRRAVEEQGYLEKLLNFSSDNPKTREQFAKLRSCMEAYLAEI